MNKTQHIKILPPSLAGKIAAGEVVQRPASVVKELVENSLDAGASSITVIIEDAGRALIQVVDDGVGMSAEDAALAFERHATSKIASYEDLENILTFGFRGEALASVAAVAHVEMRTRARSAEVGTRVRIEGGILIEIAEEAHSQGTSISVRNLFFNTPGRRSFLKSNATEFKHLFDAVQRIALSHPEVAFKVISNNDSVLNVKKSTLAERLKEMFGEKAAKSVFYFEHRGEMASCSGFLGKPDYSRKTSSEQYLYLNGRTIHSRNLGHAVYNAYERMLEKGSFPFFVLFLNIDPKKVDVNVHPSKMEVKFADEQGMYRLVMTAVRNALGSQNLIPDIGMREQATEDGGMHLRFFRKEEAEGARPKDWREYTSIPAKPAESNASLRRTDIAGANRSVGSLPEDFLESLVPEKAVSAQTSLPVTEGFSRFWQFQNKYILIPINDALMLVDQHAAHERVLYEKTIERFENSHKQSQHLLFPLTIEVNAGDAALIREILPFLEGLGFQLKLFGSKTVVIDGIPVDVKPRDEETILSRVLDLYKETAENGGVKLEPRERLAISYSCRAAVKAGDPLSDPEIRSLLDQLFATKLPYTCPHGRPVIINLSLSELDRRFGRSPKG